MYFPHSKKKKKKKNLTKLDNFDLSFLVLTLSFLKLRLPPGILFISK